MKLRLCSILRPGRRVEYLDCELFDRGALDAPPVGSLTQLVHSSEISSNPGVMANLQSLLLVDEAAAFLPNIAVLRQDAPPAAVPPATAALLVLEIANKQPSFEHMRKLPRYAAANIPEAWMCDLVDDCLERHTDPCDGIYQHVAVARRGEQLASTMLPNLVLDVNTILGPREAAEA